MFRQQEEHIKQALKGKQVHIEHVDSTSVPGFCEKHVIDILLLVEDLSDEDSYAVHLQNSGYTLRIQEPEWFAHHVQR